MNGAEFSIFGTQFTASAVIVFLWRLIEHWIPNAANLPPTLNRSLLWFVSACGAIGVHYSFSSGSGTLVITGLTAATALHGLWHLVQSISIQEFVHGSTKAIAQKP